MRFKASYILFGIIGICITLMVGSCKKEKKTLSVGGVLEFSDDTLSFDTVFTKAGSFTNGLLIYNPQDKEVVLSSVRLLHGTSSYFHLNVDGTPGNAVTNVRIAAHDSVYVFATVDIDPNNAETPFLVTDSLVATLNGNDFYAPFIAYGQNAHYIVDSILTGNAVWDTSLPYVILHLNVNPDTPLAGGLIIAPGATLTLKPGCRIYMHQTASVLVLGTLLSQGTKTDSVIFQGDRIDRRYFGYEGYPGEWGSIYIDNLSYGSKMSYTRIENGGNGAYLPFAASILVYPDSLNKSNTKPAPTVPQLTMDHSIVRNSIGYGLLCIQGSVVATNCLFTATGAYAYAAIQGGFDSLTNCTFTNYGGTGLSHSSAGTVAILNYYKPDQYHIYPGNLNAVLRNCIVYGSLDSEIVCDAVPDAAAALTMDHCLLNMGTVHESFINFNNCIFNKDPLFNNTSKGDYTLKVGSPAIATGTNIFAPIDDIKGTTRDAASIDMGCYKY
jgi:hypothetical protein